MTQRIIDAWIQHTTARMVDEPMAERFPSRSAVEVFGLA